MLGSRWRWAVTSSSTPRSDLPARRLARIAGRRPVAGGSPSRHGQDGADLGGRGLQQRVEDDAGTGPRRCRPSPCRGPADRAATGRGSGRGAAGGVGRGRRRRRTAIGRRRRQEARLAQALLDRHAARIPVARRAAAGRATGPCPRRRAGACGPGAARRWATAPIRPRARTSLTRVPLRLFRSRRRQRPPVKRPRRVPGCTGRP